MRVKQATQQRIMQLCSERHLTLNGLAKVTGVTQSTLNNIVSGRNNSACISTIQKICDGLEMDMAEFFSCDLFRNNEQEIV